MANPSDDIVPVRNTLVLLKRLRCPEVQLGQGTSLFQQDEYGNWPLTPDIVAGPFYGPGDPRNFYIDVVAPTGKYMTLDAAGAPTSAGFLRSQIAGRTMFGLDEIPPEYARPLTASLRAKATKYAGRGRGGSPLFGLVAYFCDRAKYGGAVFASLGYLRALDIEYGGVPYEAIMERLLGAETDTVVRVRVRWDVPAAFVIYARRLTNDSFAAAILVNRHDRLSQHQGNAVVNWSLTCGAESRYQTSNT